LVGFLARLHCALVLVLLGLVAGGHGVDRLHGSNLTSLWQGYINYQIRDIMGGGKIWDFKKGEGKSGEKKRRK
jgi:hypothetical protein